MIQSSINFLSHPSNYPLAYLVQSMGGQNHDTNIAFTTKLNCVTSGNTFSLSLLSS